MTRCDTEFRHAEEPVSPISADRQTGLIASGDTMTILVQTETPISPDEAQDRSAYGLVHWRATTGWACRREPIR